MKKSFIVLLMAFVCLLGDCLTKNHAKQVVIVNQQQEVADSVLQILELTGIEYDGSLADIVAQTQQSWLRKPDQERWQMEQEVIEHEQSIKHVFDTLGLYTAVEPTYQEYDYVLILGALFSRIKDRLAYVLYLWNKGVRFKQIVFLGAARPAVAAQGENMQEYLDWIGRDGLDMQEPQTETDVMKFVYHHMSMPDEVKNLPVTFIDTPMLENSIGVVRRPTTGNTIDWWLKEDPKPGSCLFVSNQPYVGYQNSVVQTLMPKSFTVETVGTGCDALVKTEIMLDTLARLLYQEQKRLMS